MVTAAPRTESAPANIEPCAEGYLDAIGAALAGALREVGTTLHEPRAVNPDRARRVLGFFVDTMTGFALGAIANHVTSGIRRWYGDEGIAAMRGALHGWPARQRIATDGSVVEQLHVQFCHLQKHARTLVEGVPARPMTAVMLNMLAKEDTIQRRVADELARGWHVYTAAVTTKRYPTMTPLWQAWQWNLDGKPVLTRDENQRAGYITLVR
ncbi:MAG: hypothetical protein M4D80_02835 [Myxococcota bacterium]|nr:hypothetical protein [Deltaproteobacteria bacterium]MDQ3334070.1 hypothetical protein [Myxococcota bacterium]